MRPDGIRTESWITLGACLFGLAFPVLWGALPYQYTFEFPLIAVVLLSPPHLAVGTTAWAVRRDRRAARVIAGVALVNVVLEGTAYWAAWVDYEGGSVILLLFGLPVVQFGVWMLGAVVSGRRPRNPPGGRRSPPRSVTS